MTVMDRILMTEETKALLDDYMVEPKHEIEVFATDDRVDRLEYENGCFDWTEISRVHKETEKVECVCGFEGETTKEAKKHLEESEEKIGFDTKQVRKALDDVALHGFEFGGLDGHGSSIFFIHQELGIRFYATPMEQLTGDKGEIGIQVDGEHRTPFKELNGRVCERVKFNHKEGLTFRQYLEIVREYVEDNLIRNRWKSEKSEEYRSRWDNTHNKNASLVIEENEDGEEPFELYEIDGINKTLLGRGGNPEIWEKATHYMSENPLAVVKSYKEVIENSEYDFKGGY